MPNDQPVAHVAGKTSKTGGPSMDEMTADAEVALSKIKNTYETVVQAELCKINEAIFQATRTPSSATDALKEIFSISHNIKGQAGSLGYPLLTAIAQSLCRFISTSEPAALKGLDVVGAHTRAMEAVIAHSIRGDGLTKGKKLLEVLDATVEQALARE